MSLPFLWIIGDWQEPVFADSIAWLKAGTDLDFGVVFIRISHHARFAHTQAAVNLADAKKTQTAIA